MTAEGKEAVGQAKGKIILLGEHAVVHGSPALASAIDRGVRVIAKTSDHGLTLTINGLPRKVAAGDKSLEGQALEQLALYLGLNSKGAHLDVNVEIPTRAGLGSSAAIAAACARALASLFETNPKEVDLYNAVQASEKVFHGNPSGLDATIALKGGVLVFSRAKGAHPIFPMPLPLLVIYSKEPGDTRETVAHFAARLKQFETEGKDRLSRIARLVELGQIALEQGDLAGLGQVMNENQDHLAWFGVSTPTLDHISKLARQKGALGAKLTGGGGGGCAVVLTRPDDTTVAHGLSEAGFPPIEL